jgi:hypothetical protein
MLIGCKGLQLKFTKLHDVAESKWTGIGQRIAKQLSWPPESHQRNAKICYDPVYIVSIMVAKECVPVKDTS